MKASVLLSLVFTVAACASTAPAERLSVVELARGNHSHQPAQMFELVNDQPRLLRIWRDLDGRMPPAIDFDEYAVVAAFMGERRTGGHSILVESASLVDSRLVVDIVMRVPGEDCFTTQALTQPYHLVVIPAYEGPVEFRPRTVSISCR
jgi:hypothetical protein